MNEWKTVKIGDVATYINGYAFKPSDWGTTGLPIIRIQNLTGNDYETNFFNGEIHPKYTVKDGDVLISWSASLGVYEWNKGKALLNQHIFKVVFDKIEVDKKYFIFTVSHLLNEMVKHTHGSTMRHITKPDFDNMPFPLPSIKEQKKISELLEKCTSIIATNKQMLEKYDMLIKSRFIEMFGDPHNNTKYSYKNVEEFTTVTSGGTPDRKNNEYWKNGKIPWVKTTELHNNELTEVEEFITQKGLDESSAKMMPKGTLLIAMYGQGKTRGMTAYLGIEASTNQACACILPSKEINQRYLWYYFILSYDKLRGLAKGGNQPNLNGNMIKSFPVLMPPIDMQNKYVSFVQQIDKSKFEMEKIVKLCYTTLM